MNNKRQLSRLKKQHGVVLIVALIFLLLISILGISAMRVTNNNTKIAGNSMFSMLVYQGAESTLAHSVSVGSEKHLIDAVLSNDAVYNVPNDVLNGSGKTVNGTSLSMKSSATITPIPGTLPCPVSESATSSIYKCRAVEISARTTLPGTGALARHIEARTKEIPF